MLLYPPDGVCIESMSLKLTKKTLAKCSQNLDSLKKQIQRLLSFVEKL